MEIKTVAVLGAGLMGHGIAEVCAMAGYNVTMRDIKQEFVDRGMNMIKESLAKLEQKGKIKSAEEVLSRIKPTVDLEEAVKDADLVIEAVPEVVEIKKQVWEEVDKLAKPDCIFTSNTSTMRITMLADFTSRPEKFAGLHFFNPPVLMRLVEVIRGEKTSDEVMDLLVEFVKSIGKTPVRVEKDVPGFIANRVVAPRGVLLHAVVEAENLTPEEVDAAFRKAGYPMGPFELADYVGIDVNYNAARYFARAVSPEYEPPERVRKMVEEGRLGRKTGRGWYDWSGGKPEIDLSKATGKINVEDFLMVEINEAVKLVEMGVAKPEDIDIALKLGYGRQKGPFELLEEFGKERVARRLEELAKKYGKKIFEPAESLRT
ncbi:3-hydroxyacyl-CoA dehydrogenase [Archaeoglobus fulgidus]|uniref:3-hydroxyacyl-CoA dehydrogenase n=1 Tax=Archaeoglobus fulgidus DSM 8774 TaxID=1344584 RepID=A0A075WFL8_ARCFL|nr:3-hydroxyacyl-CoA dehydrogenase [Archaeoglobus fulgidus]AIG97904.1 3-hydroxyacyl-CoA dehydrogenase [Archaeoglobus fulgidus DSM 8774]